MTQTSLDFAPISRVPLTREEQLVWDQVGCRRGRPHAISIAELRRRTGLDERQVKGAVEGLIVRHDICIASARTAPCGYFLPATAAELLDACRPLRRQALAMLHREAKLRRLSLEDLLGQLRVEFSDESQRRAAEGAERFS